MQDPAPTIPGPRLPVGPHRLRCPPLSCDSNAHVFGPHAKYPLDPARRYTPPELPIGDYLGVLRALGIERAVLVQPSVYLLDNTALLDALEQAAFPLRGVVAVDGTISETELERMTASGVRGARLTLAVANGVSLADMPELAGKIAGFGWHVQVSAANLDLANHGSALAALPVDLVFDHIARPDVREGIGGASFRALLNIVEKGRSWVKLSAPMRSSAQAFPYADTTPFIRELVRLFPDRLLWGSDWPHTTIGGEMPDDGALLDLLLDWVEDEAVRTRVLVDNPARVYGF